MTQDEILKIANDMAFMGSIWIEDDSDVFKDMIKFAKLIAAKEREACAKLVESFQRDHIYTADLAGAIGAIKHKLADAIRARSISRGDL